MEMKVKYDGKKFVEFEGETVAEALLKVDGTLVKCGIDAGSFKAVTIDKLDFSQWIMKPLCIQLGFY